ncbi:MAG: hypothetical protein WA702_07020 [Bradyrhizobium sp.]|jgi:hypothetical protein|uniref:hypothetical protein n=1 Tax=Bradyrhizobium sp. TaxID=376 RepID=UPI003C7D0F87
MLRSKVLIAAVPLIAVVAIVARLEASPAARPCIPIGAGNVEIGSEPWHADLHVDFTDDPKLATVRVGLADNAGDADFVMVDDGAEVDDKACDMTAATQSVAMAADPTHRSALIYLAQNGPADYRVFVRSSRFSVHDAAALIVGAHVQDQLNRQPHDQQLAEAAP